MTAPPGRAPSIAIHGAGPAGCAAAIAARLAGAEVDLYDPSPFPRHKVCGEFLSPEALPILESLGLAGAFAALEPQRYRDIVLRFGARAIRSPLPTPAYGISRHAFDQLLLTRAVELGARLHRERGPSPDGRPVVLAHGRAAPTASPRTTTRQSPHKFARKPRLFAFKTHFAGVPADPLTLYFHGGAYLGINAVERGAINLCGLAPEPALRATAFSIDEFLQSLPGLSPLLAPLTRAMPWLITGPLAYGQHFGADEPYRYRAGDALSFIDPFTGSGLLCALYTGKLAGLHAASGIPSPTCLALCRRALRRPFLAASFIRNVLATPLASPLAARIPARWLVQGTRPSMALTR